MSSKEDKAQAAADRIKAAAMEATKGLSRAQAERAAAAAARNVNAYGQKEEGPSRWQERKEAKRQMYLMSTEKAVRLGERKDNKASNSSSSLAAQCQKCFQSGHWTFECKNQRVYMTRPSRSQQLKNPNLKMKLSAADDFENPDAGKEANDNAKSKKKSKRKKRSVSDSDDESSDASDSDSGSASSGTDASDESNSSETSSDSEDRRRERRQRQRKAQKKRHRRRDTSSSESESESKSDSDDKNSRRRSRKHHR